MISFIIWTHITQRHNEHKWWKAMNLNVYLLIVTKHEHFVTFYHLVQVTTHLNTIPNITFKHIANKLRIQFNTEMCLSVANVLSICIYIPNSFYLEYVLWYIEEINPHFDIYQHCHKSVVVIEWKIIVKFVCSLEFDVIDQPWLNSIAGNWIQNFAWNRLHTLGRSWLVRDVLNSINVYWT